jgi:hypothetical protein
MIYKDTSTFPVMMTCKHAFLCDHQYITALATLIKSTLLRSSGIEDNTSWLIQAYHSVVHDDTPVILQPECMHGIWRYFDIFSHNDLRASLPLWPSIYYSNYHIKQSLWGCSKFPMNVFMCHMIRFSLHSWHLWRNLYQRTVFSKN